VKSDLKLEIERKKNGTLITWRDALNNSAMAETVRNILLVVWFLIFVVVMFTSLQNVSVAPIFIMGAGLIGVLFLPEFIVPKFVHIPRFVTISKTRFKTFSGEAPIGDISRIDYGRRGEWDMSDHKKKDRTQVRAWVRDEYSIVIAENNWTTTVNHKLRDTIAKALDDVP